MRLKMVVDSLDIYCVKITAAATREDETTETEAARAISNNRFETEKPMDK